MIDPYTREYPFSLINPASDLLDITPDDEVDLAQGIKSLRIWNPETTNAVVAVTTLKGNETLINVGPGLTVECLRVSQVLETGTTTGLTIQGYTD